MRKIALILAVQFTLLSTQPIWQPLKQALFGSCGGGGSCSLTAMSCAASSPISSLPLAGKAGNQPTKGCCAPFQCCFPCCCYCQPVAQFPDFAEGKKNTRPNETTKTLYSASIGGPFQPPEFA